MSKQRVPRGGSRDARRLETRRPDAGRRETGRSDPKRPAPKRADPSLERIFGRHSVRAVFLTRPGAVRRLVVAAEDRQSGEFIAAAEEAGVVPEVLARADFQHVGGFTREEVHQGVFVLAEPRRIYSEKDFDLLEKAKTVLALDQISNPPNLAAMVRSAAFFGVDAIMLLRDRSVDVSSEVVRYAVGGAEFVKFFRVTNLSQSLEALKDFGFHVVGLDERGTATLAETRFPEKVALVVGAEGDGLRPKTKKYCDALVSIPGGRQGLESLNAGVATAIAMAEIFRERPPAAG